VLSEAAITQHKFVPAPARGVDASAGTMLYRIIKIDNGTKILKRYKSPNKNDNLGLTTFG
jgi:hypothetical protein